MERWLVIVEALEALLETVGKAPSRYWDIGLPGVMVRRSLLAGCPCPVVSNRQGVLVVLGSPAGGFAI